MKVAYLILCHIDPQHIRRLAIKLTKGTQNEAFIHVDAKSDFSAFQECLSGIPGVHILEKRVSVHWGGYSAIEATMALLRAALAAGDFDRFSLQQGLNYPIRSNAEIDAFYTQHPQTEFLLAQNISISTQPRDTHKYRLYYFMDHRDNPLVFCVRAINWLIRRTNIILPLKPNYAVTSSGEKMQIHQGCAEFDLTRQAVEYIVKFHDENPRFNRYFQTEFAPDESYFHTILYNSPFVRNTPDGKAVTRPSHGYFKNLVYFEYPVQVILFTKKEDWPKIRDSGFLYFRKASSESKELLDLIDEVHEGQAVI